MKNADLDAALTEVPKIREEEKEKNQSEFERHEIKALHKGIKIVGGDAVARLRQQTPLGDQADKEEFAR